VLRNNLVIRIVFQVNISLLGVIDYSVKPEAVPICLYLESNSLDKVKTV